MITSHAEQVPDATWVPSLLEVKVVVDQLDSYFNGLLHAFEIPLDQDGSEFQVKVWHELSRIPFGQKHTYGDVAKAIGQPKATRRRAGDPSKPIAIVRLSTASSRRRSRPLRRGRIATLLLARRCSH